jgi:glycosyltransferase 2 family protein
VKQIISLAVSIAILGAIYLVIDIGSLLRALRGVDVPLTISALAVFVPILSIMAWRLKVLIPTDHRPSLAEALRLILSASAMNMVLPSKMGDVAKSAFMKKSGGLSGSKALAVVVLEKTSDVLALLVWCVFGLMVVSPSGPFFQVLFAAVALGLLFCIVMLGSLRFADFFFVVAFRIVPQKLGAKIGNLRNAWHEMHGFFWRHAKFSLGIIFTSIVLWFLNLAQIWLFALAVGGDVPFIDNLALAPLALLAGLLPLTFAGIGTRDAALIVLFQPFMDSGTAAALGLFCTLRYIVPALAGLPFLTGYLEALRNNGD